QVSKHNGLRSYIWQQEFDGLEVAGGVLTAHITREAELVGVSSQFVGELEAAAEAGTPRRRQLQFAPAITAIEAVRASAESVGENVVAAEIRSLAGDVQTRDKRQQFRAANLPGVADARLVWLPLSGTALRL